MSSIWCEKMCCIFKVMGALPYIDGTLPCPNKETDPKEWKTWDFNDSFEQCLVTSNVKAKQMIHIGQAQTAYQTWQNLASVYVPKGYQIAMAVSRNYHDTQVKKGRDVVEHLNKLKKLWEWLNLFGNEDYKISDTQFKAHIASSLPPSWDIFTEPYVGCCVGVKEANSKKLIHSQEFIGIIKEEYLWHKSRVDEEKSDQTYFSQNQQVNKKHSLGDCLKDVPLGSKSYPGPSCKNCGHPSHDTKDCWWLRKPKCNKCGYFGHLKKDCKKHKGKNLKRKGEKKSEKDELKKKKKADEFQESHIVEEEIVCYLDEDKEMYNFDTYDLSNPNKIDERLISYNWLADSAMTSHVSNTHEMFTNFQLLQKAAVIGVGNISMQAEGWGIVKLESKMNGLKYIVKLNDVLYIPSNKQNLFLLGCWNKAGGYYIGGKNQLILISKDGKNIAKGNKISNNLYKMNLKPQNLERGGLTTQPESYVNTEPAQSWEIWHWHFGHVGYTGLNKCWVKVS